MVALEKYWHELQNTFRKSISARLGYIHEAQLLKTLCDAHAGKNVPIVRVLWTISLEYWLRDLAARGLLSDSRVAERSSFGRRQLRKYA